MAALPKLRAPSSPLRRRLSRALGIAAAAYLLALAVASSAPVERGLRERIDGALRARLGDVRVGPELRVDPLFRVWFGPVEIPGPGGPPLLRAATAMARPSLRGLLHGRVEPATVLLGDVRLRPGPEGRDLRALLERLRARRAFGGRETADDGAGRDLPKLKLRGLVVTVPFRGEPLELGPIDADLLLLRARPGPRLRAVVSLRSGGRLSLDAERGEDGWRAALRADRLGADTIPPALRSRAAAVREGTLTIEADAEAPADLSRASVRVRGELEGLVLAGERIAPEPVGPLRASAAGRLDWDRAARRVVLSEGVATLLRAVTVGLSGELATASPATFSASLHAEVEDWAAAVAALPPALAIPLQAPRPSGPLQARLEVSGPPLSPDDWSLSASLELAALREAARRAGRPPLAEPFLHRPPLDAGGLGPPLRIGPSSPDFVPIAELPDHVVRAVTASEDGGFFGHSGFDFDELRHAIAAGARRGRVVRGGSTISQQVAKNLFLGPERTFARKVREAAITVGLEATLPKRRLLEIYLNVAEWGPGIWGIGPAARHWLGKDARQLTPKEAAFLASVIPRPLKAHATMFARGAPTEWSEGRVRDLLFIMASQGTLSDGQLAEALAQPLTFPSALSAASATEAPASGALPSPDEPDADAAAGDQDPPARR